MADDGFRSLTLHVTFGFRPVPRRNSAEVRNPCNYSDRLPSLALILFSSQVSQAGQE